MFKWQDPLRHEISKLPRKLVEPVLLQKIFKKWYSNPSRRDGTPQCLALRYQVIAKNDNVVEYIKTSLVY